METSAPVLVPCPEEFSVVHLGFPEENKNRFELQTE